MRYTKFYFPDGSEGAEGGGGATETAPIVETKPVDSILTAEDLKEYGLENADQLRTILRQHKESNIPAADKEKEEQTRKADFISFAAKEGHMKVEEINSYESLKSKSDRDLRFEKYVDEWKEDNPEITDQDEVLSQAKADFENEFKLNSDSEKQKARGEARLKKEADELRNPYTSKYEKTQSAYQERKALEGKLPEFNKAVASLIEKCTPDKLPISKVKDGEEEFPIEVELTKKERDELIQTFVTPKTYQAYVKNEKDLSKFEGEVRKKIDGFLKVKYFETSLSKAYETGKGRGIVRGSNVGAEQPFSIIRGKGAPGKEGNGVATLEQSNDKVAAARARFAK
jgi:hypothetical protein